MKKINRFIVFLMFMFLFIVHINTSSAESSWMNVGDPLFSAGEAYNISFDIDSGGVPYIAYSDGSSAYEATVMRFNGSAWVNVGDPLFSTGEASGLSLAFDNNNVPYVAYSDGSSAYEATVMRFNGSAWVNVGDPLFSAGLVRNISLDFDSSGVPYVAYSDNTNSRGATVMKFNGSAWVNVGSVNFSNGRVDYTSLAIDGDNVPYVAYRNYSDNSKITAMKYTGVGDTGWEVVGDAGFSTGVGGLQIITQDVYKISLVIDDNIPYIVYSDGEDSYKAMVMKYNGLTWEEVGTSGTGFSDSDAWYTSLDFDSDNVPYVVYSDSSDNEGATLMKYASATETWINVGETNFSSGAAYYTSLAIDDDIPYVAYAYYWDNDFNLFDGNSTVMKYDSLDSTPPNITGLTNTTTPAKSVTWNWGSDDGTATYRYHVTTSDSFIFDEEVYGATTTISQTIGNGTYYLYVEVKNSSNNTSSTRVSAILDNIAPTIDISGNNPESIYVGSSYVDGGATAMDAQDGITTVTRDNNVNTLVAGVYYVEYSSRDVAGNVGSASRQVNVMPRFGGGMPSDWLKKPKIPTDGFQIVVNQGSENVTNRIVNLGFNAEKDVTRMAISLTSDFRNASLENYQSSRQLDICLNKGLVCTWGEYVVYVKFYTQYGVASDVISKKINLTNSLISAPILNSVTMLFKQNFKYGQTSGDIKELQKFLNKNNYFVAKSGAGSPGKETTYFGAATRTALVKFQKANNITPSSGYFGPLTRRVINEN